MPYEGGVASLCLSIQAEWCAWSCGAGVERAGNLDKTQPETGQTTHTTWLREIRAIGASASEAAQRLNDLRSWIRGALSHHVAEEAFELVDALSTALREIEEGQKAAVERYFEGPASSFFRRRFLTREEFYLVAAMAGPPTTAKRLGLSDFDDYDVFSMLCYQDNTRTCYIDPLAKSPSSRSGKVGLRLGAAPEELQVGGLRPEQHKFFAEFMPAVYGRFQGSSANAEDH